MKKYILLCGLLLTSASCESVLDKVPVNRYVAESYLINQDGMQGMLTAAYDALGFGGQYNGTLFWIGEMAGDGAIAGPGENNSDILEFDRVNVTPLNGPLLALWQNSYRSIQAANIVLVRSDGITFMPASQREVVKGQAAFIRALCYFNLVRIFGDVPLVLNETLTAQEVNVRRSAAGSVYDQIIRDLQLAENALPDTWPASERGRVVKGAAKGLLAKVYLTQRRWQEAAAKAKEVIDNPAYSLVANYADIFSVSGKNSPEGLFEIQHTPPLDGGSFMMEFMTPAGVTVGSRPGLGRIAAAQALILAHEPADKRRELYAENNNRFWSRKYQDAAAPGNSPNSARNNFPVLRLADVLLIYAEALNEQGYGNQAAFAAINQVRSRAGLPPLTSASTSTQEAFRQAVYRERFIELAFEGHRWFDLVRTGFARTSQILQANAGATLSENRMIFPIPQRELDINPNLAPQNPGY